MRRFAALYTALDACGGTTERVRLLSEHFASADPRDGAWALHVLLGRQRKRLITGRRLRQICLEAGDLPEWLFDACHAQVGDSAETIALLWRSDGNTPQAVAPPQPSLPQAPPRQVPRSGQPALHRESPLHTWMEELLPAAAALEGEAQAVAVRRLWQGLEPSELLVANKLLTGGLRVGVAQGLVLRALAQLSGLEVSLLQHRLMGGFEPGAAAFTALLAPTTDAQEIPPSRPYPFFLASPLEPGAAEEGGAPLEGPASDWLIEWKWDGIRAQLIRRRGETFLWSRGEELINDGFPELIAAAAALPDGSVLDGELLVWPEAGEQPAPFSTLQRRLGRRAPGRRLLAECPVCFVAYDLLEQAGEDRRATPLLQRRRALEDLLETWRCAVRRAAGERAGGPGGERLRLSPRLPLTSWQELEGLRRGAAAVGAEGLMLKAAGSPYLAGRRRGHWWKHKREPHRLDAVLLYAQAGSGRRANLFTDYTFGLWDRPAAACGAVADSADGERHGGTDLAASGQNDRSGSGSGEPSQAGMADRTATAPRLVSFAKAYSGLSDAEIVELDRWIRRHTSERFGPVRAVEPLQVFELAFEAVQPSSRHRSGLAVRFPRISRWRRDKPAHEADCLDAARALIRP